jgi:hypothetical protein
MQWFDGVGVAKILQPLGLRQILQNKTVSPGGLAPGLSFLSI